MRFGQVARLWDKIYPPGSPVWKAYLEEHLKLGTTFDPTLTTYSAGRDLMKFRNADWHPRYTLPSLMAFYAPSRQNHGSYWYYWTTYDAKRLLADVAAMVEKQRSRRTTTTQ